MKYFLVGYMGCGKSTIGRRLARQGGCRFVDTDAEIESEQGRSIKEIFEAEGEEYFRAVERQTLARLAAEEGDMIVATGGGMPVWHDNMEVMNRTGVTVYLKMSPSKLAARLAGTAAKRPILEGKSREELPAFIEKALEARRPFYEKASMVIDCDGVREDYVCGHIMEMMQMTERAAKASEKAEAAKAPGTAEAAKAVKQK